MDVEYKIFSLIRLKVKLKHIFEFFSTSIETMLQNWNANSNICILHAYHIWCQMKCCSDKASLPVWCHGNLASCEAKSENV